MSKKPRDEQKTKKEQVAEWLRDTIIAGELEPGERLLQDELAERFAVSATPIREAIQLLVAEGVLSHSPYKGVQVAEVQMDDVREVYLIRCELEALATRFAVPNLRLAEVKQLHELQKTIESHVRDHDLQPLRKLNYDFHMIIYHAAEMPLLYNMIRSLWTRFPWDTLHVLPDRAGNSTQEHLKILAAIDDVNPEMAGAAMREHVETGMKALGAYLSGQK